MFCTAWDSNRRPEHHHFDNNGIKNLNSLKTKSWNLVCLYWSRCYSYGTHRRYPTTVLRDCFDLLHFWPRPIHSSLTNLESSGSPNDAILTQDLVRTPGRHEAMRNRYPDLKPSSNSGLPIAWITERASAPAERRRQN